MIVVSIFRCT